MVLISFLLLVIFPDISHYVFHAFVLCIISGCFMPSMVIFRNYVIMHCYNCTGSRLYAGFTCPVMIMVVWEVVKKNFVMSFFHFCGLYL